VIPAGDKHGSRRIRTLWIALAIVVGVLAAGAAGVSYAAYDYGQKYEGKILPGSTIAGVDVGGMREAQAVAAVKDAIAPQLNRKIKVTWKNHDWKVTPQKLGARSNAVRMVHAALRASSKNGFMDNVKMSVFGDRFSFHRDIAITYPKQGVRGYVAGLADSIKKKPVDATIDYSTGWVKTTASHTGRKINPAKSRAALSLALRKGLDEAKLSVKTLKPEVTEDHFDKVLLVRIGENKLYLYENGQITHSWSVAPGQPLYPTPQGVFEITEKRYMPTWINPQPDGWGSTLPPEIPPGIGNPLGLRALNWSASGIRFHGTTATYSLGYNASHGCVRMSNPDVIELYDLVDVGTPIVSVQVAPLRPLGSTAATQTTIDPNQVSGGN
jgi:lipoprotein-anchoring transpeptidase ErfK/SrfK